MNLICLDRDRCLRWAQAQIPFHPEAFANWWTAIGHEADGELIAAVFYTQPDSSTDLSMHVVARPGSRWMTQGFVRVAFAYPFKQEKMHRVSASAPAANEPFQRMLELLGFRREGTKRRLVDGGDVVIFGMLREECRYG